MFDNFIGADFAAQVGYIPAGSDKKSLKKFAQLKNSLAFQNVATGLANICLNMFKWHNLPSTANERALEQCLFFYGKALFFRDLSERDLGLMHTPFSFDNGINVYFQNINRRAYSFNYNYQYNIDNSVIIPGVPNYYPQWCIVQHYSSLISDADRTIDVFSKSLKRPYVIVTSDEAKLSTQNMIDQIHENEYVVFTVKSFADMNTVNVQPSATASASQGLLHLWEHKKNLMDEALTRLGINTAKREKRERLIQDEVSANNQITDINLNMMLNCREKAAKEINDMFGTEITVTLNPEYQKEMGDNGDGNVYDRIRYID